MRRTDKRPTVAGVVRYARARQRQARLRNDRWARLNWEEVELVLLDAAYGTEPQSHRFRQPTRVVVASEPRQLTRYQTEMNQRPLRKVVRRLEVMVAANYPMRAELGYVEVLECGHKMPVRVDCPGETRSKHRRCEKCRVAARSAKVVTMPRLSA